MSTKYGKYIVTQYLNEEELASRGLKLPKKEPGHPHTNYTVWLDSHIIEGAFFTEAALIEPGPIGEIPQSGHQSHEWDEVLAFIGTNPENPQDLGGTIELMLGDEIHTLEKTSLVFIPRGLAHLPLTFKKIDRPVVFLAIGNSNHYTAKDW